MTEKLSDNGLIHAQDLYYLLGQSDDIKILDATYMVPGGTQTPYDAYLSRHIDGAQFFDIDAVADQNSTLPHMAPTPDYFASCVSALGIKNEDHVVIYDQSGMYMASSRAWWLFRLFGHENVYVLNGGLQAWIRAGFPVEEGIAEPPSPSDYKASFRRELLVTKEDLLANLKSRAHLVLDARPAERFAGLAPEPRPGMRAGHIPDSLNLPFANLLDPHIRTVREAEQLEQIFSGLSIDKSQKIAVSCGSGVTACTVALALYAARHQDSAIYDGSWSEWGAESAGTPIEDAHNSQEN
jgi:thiosulfate/3-mercaptopyruvate sulfurtransferase